MSYVSHDGLAYFKHKLDQKFISNITSENGALKIILGDGTVLKSIQDTTVTQKKSTANELYPLLLCYDAMADQDQLSKETWFGQHILANPYYGYLASRGMYVKHPTFNRRNGVSQKVEWAYDFTDAVSGLGNPMSQVYAYVDPAAQGGEHCIELRLYGNPNVSPTVPSINDSTNTFSIGVGVTGGNVKFGYCPSTPLYLDNGSTLRTEATGHGNDIITRDWLNLNGSLTGLVHTTMNETIDGAKTFKKTVTINSGDNNNKAGLYVQGNSDVHGNEHVYGTETVDGKLTANGTAEIKGGSGNTPSLTVTGSEYVSGNSNIHGNMDVDGNSNTDGNQTVGGTSTITGKLTANGTAEIKGGSGNNPSLTVTGNETVTGNSSVGGNSSITGNETVGGNISTTNGNISTTNGTVSGKAGSIGTGGLTVAGNETVTGKITGNNGAEISGGNGLVVNGNETVNGEIYKVVNNTPQEYVSYVTNKQETKTTIVNNLIKDKGGLAVDSNKNIYVSLKSGGGVKLNNNGELYVDFSLDSGASEEAQAAANAMKEQILSTLGMQIPLTGAMTLFVDKDNVNATDSWRSNQGVIDKTVGTENKPFKTIQAAINCATQGYSLGSNTIVIRVKKASTPYIQCLTLPEFNRSTGHITIEAYDIDDPVIITNVDSSNPDIRYVASSVLNCTGGYWRIYALDIRAYFSAPDDNVNHYPSCVYCGATGQLDIMSSCHLTATYSGPAHSRSFYFYLVSCFAGGSINLIPYAGYATYLTTSYGNATGCSVFYLERGSRVSMPGTNTEPTGAAAETVNDTLYHAIRCSGSMTKFMNITSNSLFTAIGGTNYYQQFVGTMTGQPYAISGGSGCSKPALGFPGDSEGYVQSSTYSWYA